MRIPSDYRSKDGLGIGHWIANMRNSRGKTLTDEQYRRMYSQVMFGKKYRKRSAKNLFDECIYITQNFPEVKEILIDDDNFAVDQENVKQFCKLMIDSKLKLKWVVQCRVTLEYDTMVLMKKAGCRLVVVGYESGSQKVLDGMHKGITLEMSKKFNDAAKKAHLRVHGCFMLFRIEILLSLA